MSKSVGVSVLPSCGMGCTRSNGESSPAYADARIPGVGSWGYLCRDCFRSYGCKLGTGLGQRLILATNPPSYEKGNN